MRDYISVSHSRADMPSCDKTSHGQPMEPCRARSGASGSALGLNQKEFAAFMEVEGAPSSDGGEGAFSPPDKAQKLADALRPTRPDMAKSDHPSALGPPKSPGRPRPTAQRTRGDRGHRAGKQPRAAGLTEGPSTQPSPLPSARQARLRVDVRAVIRRSRRPSSSSAESTLPRPSSSADLSRGTACRSSSGRCRSRRPPDRTGSPLNRTAFPS